MNLVGIDISIDSCAISIFRKNEIIISNFTTQKKSTSWIKKTMDVINYEFINYTYKDVENYTESEIIKLREYDHVTDLIYNKIIGNVDRRDNSLISIEGYNYSMRNTNSLIDIVSFSTILRLKLLKIPKLEKIIIVSPKTVKSLACEMSYGFYSNAKGKKIINKNPNGIAGGKFDKKDMVEAFINMNENDKLSTLLNKYKNEFLKLKNIPKPIDDLVDADFLRRIIS